MNSSVTEIKGFARRPRLLGRVNNFNIRIGCLLSKKDFGKADYKIAEILPRKFCHALKEKLRCKSPKLTQVGQPHSAISVVLFFLQDKLL